jgi:hypothetical protein
MFPSATVSLWTAVIVINVARSVSTSLNRRLSGTEFMYNATSTVSLMNGRNQPNHLYHDDSASCHVGAPFRLGPDWWHDDHRFSDIYKCTLDGENKRKICDFSKLETIFRAPCEKDGGTFYTITGDMTCPSDESHFVLHGIKLPYCATNCDIKDLMDQGLFEDEGCINEMDEITTFAPIVGEVCNKQIHSFTDAAGGGDPRYVFKEYDDWTHKNCSKEQSDTSCDFAQITEQLRLPCEEEGGELYSFSYKLHYGIENSDLKASEEYLNLPLCLGSACNASSYFEEYIFSILEFKENRTNKNHKGKVISRVAFESIRYEKVMDINTSTVLVYNSPTVSPSISPTLSPSISPSTLPSSAPNASPTIFPSELPSNTTPLKTLDQLYPNCKVPVLNWFGDHLCDGGVYNTVECGFDGGACDNFNIQYPNCHVPNPYMIGDGDCDEGEYNTPECQYDGGDCHTPFNTSDPTKFYPNCNAPILSKVGDSWCDGAAYNTPECEYDGGDCLEFNTQYPDCNIENPDWVGDGYCDLYGGYNTIHCGFDGGDCQS